MNNIINELSITELEDLINDLPSLSREIRRDVFCNWDDIIHKIGISKPCKIHKINSVNALSLCNINQVMNPNEATLQRTYSKLMSKANHFIDTHRHIRGNDDIVKLYSSCIKILNMETDTLDSFTDVLFVINNDLNSIDLLKENHPGFFALKEYADYLFNVLIYKSHAIATRNRFETSSIMLHKPEFDLSGFVYTCMNVIYIKLKNFKNTNDEYFIFNIVRCLYSQDLTKSKFLIRLCKFYITCEKNVSSIKVDDKDIDDTSRKDFLDLLAHVDTSHHDYSRLPVDMYVIIGDNLIPSGVTKNDFCNFVTNLAISNKFFNKIPNQLLTNYFGIYKDKFKSMSIFSRRGHHIIIEKNGELCVMRYNSSTPNSIWLFPLQQKDQSKNLVYYRIDIDKNVKYSLEAGEIL